MADFIDDARYWISVLFVISAPPAVAYWFIVHPFVAFWRRLGRKLAFWILAFLFLLVCFLLYLVRDDLLGRDLGASWLLFALGLPLFVITIAVALERKKYLTFWILAGAPELSEGEDHGAMLSEGIYARIRHPRYLEFLLGSVAWALWLNFSGVYWMTVVAIAGIFVIVPIEEKELKDRFGEDYVEYCERVPRFIPRLGKVK